MGMVILLTCSGCTLWYLHKTSESIDVLVKEIALKLRLPQNLTTKCLETLHDNGIYIAEPLRKATEAEWTKLNLPVAFARELKERVIAKYGKTF